MKRRRLKRAAWIALAGLLLLISLLGAALGLLLYHPAGPHWVLQLIRSFTPVTIEVTSIEGRLAGPLAIQGVKLDDGRISAQIDALDFDWHPAALLAGEFYVETLSLTDFDLKLPPDEPSSQAPAAGGFEGVAIPLSLRLDQLQLEGLTIERPEADPIRIERVSLTSRSRNRGLELERFTLAMPQLMLDARGQVGLGAELPLDLRLEWRYSPPQRTPLEGEGRVSGDLRRLQIGQTLRGALEGEFEASLSDLTEALSWESGLMLERSDLEGWLGDFPLQLSGELKSRGTLERIGLQADLNLTQADYGEAAVTLEGEYAEGRFRAGRLLIETAGGSRLEGSGDYTPDEALGSFDGELAWRDLRWPLQGEPQMQSPQGSLKFEGEPEDYDYILAATLQLPAQPSAKLEAEGGGGLQGIRLQSLQVDFAPGRLLGRGEIAWQPALAWTLQLEGEGIDPSLWAADFPGSIRLALETSGRLDAAGIAAGMRIDRMQGQLRGYPLEARASADLAGQVLTLSELRLNSGANRIEMSGTLARNLDLDWRIDAPELQALWPGLEGSLAGEGRLEGPRQTPRIKASLNGEGLSYEDYRARQLKMAADFAMAGKQALTLDLRLSDLRLGRLSWERLDLQASGTLPKHRLDLELAGESAPGLRLSAVAGWSDEALWRGALDALQLEQPGHPPWRLSESAGFTLGGASQRLESLCLAREAARLCGSFKRTPADGWEADLTAQQFALASLSPWLPEGLRLEGRGELQARLRVDGEGHPRGRARLQLPEGRVGLDLEKEAERLDFAGGELRGRIDTEGAELRIDLPLAGLGEVRAALELPGFDPSTVNPAEQKLQGRLGFDLRDLSRLSLISPRLRNPRGVIAGEFSLAGTLRRPELHGSAELNEGALDIPELGLELRGIDLQLTAPRFDRLALRGDLDSGDGRLQLEGQLELDAEAGFPARLRLTGKRLKVANLPQAEVEVTPDLSFEREGRKSRLEGRIEIPYARLRPRKLPSSAVSVTPDLVVVGADEPERPAFDTRLSAKLRVVMGDRVSFDGFGLRGKLTGSLLVIDEPNRPVIGRGRIGISKGTYQAYGQDLTIERGFVLFADSPVDNPGLDVRAVREIDEVTAGVRVSGTLKSPKIDLFSSPIMGESDTISYLLTGRPAGEGGGSGVGVAAALKATGAGTVAEELGRQFGLEELRLDAGNTLEEASVVAGTYLSPRLYIQYINELASRETKLRLRYDINRRLQLEAESGKTQAGDLYYTFDR